MIRTAAARFDARETHVSDPQLGDLPLWDFSGLYAEPADEAVSADIAAAAEEAKAIAADYEGKMADLTGDQLAEAIARYERIDSRLGRVMSYIGLRYYQNTTDPARAKALGDAQGKSTEATTPLVFFTLELNKIDEAALEAKLAQSEALRRYKPWLDRLRALAPHQLSDELERYLHDTSVVGSAAWNRLFDETMADLKFSVALPEGTQELSIEPTLTLLTDASREKRAAASAALDAVFAQNIRLFTLITNTLAKEKEIDDRWRKLPSPQAARHLSNQVEPEVVQALRDAVVAAYPRLSHRYYRLKAGWLGLEKMAPYDRNAPLPQVEDRKVGWDEARDTVLGAYGDFAPKMAEMAETFFARNWIDAPVRPGKAPGAFAHPTVADAHPFVMLNYLGKTRDVMTLAHELGHGVHQILAAGQGELLSRTPLTLAETASVFGEMLTFKRILKAQTDPAKRKALLAGKVEDMINTVVRQIAFYEFECRVHAARREGELTADDLGEIWMAVQTESLGDVFDYHEGYKNYWSYIPHFIHSPFYVYAYAFGDGLVNALYAVYESGQVENFEGKYFDLLAAGGTKGHKELLVPFGLDASDPAFWQKGLSVIEGMISELEALDATV
ncbi:MAG: M3 family oligoendopeptidase [Neomegalonema sp.]|nr:M3 family oligoendopeptidase [Neomegalonema sp.]